MKLELGANNRMLIYFFFDREGVVDDYILYMLREMKKCVKDIVVVSNGKITDAGKKKLGLYVGDIIERDNKGFDVWAYKTALERIGWEKLALYDEVIMMNYTIMGPVYPLREMFDAMDVRDLDFWGPTISHKTDFDPWGNCALWLSPGSYSIPLYRGSASDADEKRISFLLGRNADDQQLSGFCGTP